MRRGTGSASPQSSARGAASDSATPSVTTRQSKAARTLYSYQRPSGRGRPVSPLLHGGRIVIQPSAWQMFSGSRCSGGRCSMYERFCVCGGAARWCRVLSLHGVIFAPASLSLATSASQSALLRSFLMTLGSGLHQLLALLQPQARGRPHLLDHLDLVGRGEPVQAHGEAALGGRCGLLLLTGGGGRSRLRLPWTEREPRAGAAAVQLR